MGTKGPSNKYGTSDRAKINFPYAKNFSNVAVLDKHFKKHGAEFGNITIEEYRNIAIKFANEIVLGNVSFVDKIGKTHKYNAFDNIYTVVSSAGKVLTLYKPEDGELYYIDQRIKLAKN